MKLQFLNYQLSIEKIPGKKKQNTASGKLRPYKIFNYLLFFIGLACYAIGIYFIWQTNNSARLPQKSYTVSKKQIVKSPTPVRIIIPDLKIDLPIYPAKIVRGEWELTAKGANYLISSPVPGDAGNSVIYAHNWTRLFGPLLDAKAGERVVIEYADKSKKIFVIQKLFEVPYNQMSVLAQTKDRRITLYTCTGFLDSKRLIAVASLEQ